MTRAKILYLSPRIFIALFVLWLTLVGLLDALSGERRDTERVGILRTDCEIAEGGLNNSAGPPNGFTGAPGESPCSFCHNTFEPNVGNGSYQISVPNSFFPTDTIDIEINLADPDQQRWGFEITALDSFENPVGELLVAEPIRTQKSIDLATLRQYVKHTSFGTDNGVLDVAPGWLVRWVSPFADVGPVTFYGAGNAANGNLSTTGDYIYTTSSSVEMQREGVRISADSLFGKETLNVNFDALTFQSPTSWMWDFGDGESSTDESPLHSYQSAGLFSVSVIIQAPEGEFNWESQNLIGIQADSLNVLDQNVVSGTQSTVEVYGRNFLPVSKMIIPVTWGGALNLSLTGGTVDGLRTESFSVQIVSFNPFGNSAVFVLTANDTNLAPGAGAVLNLSFIVPDIQEQTAQVNVVENSGFAPKFVSTFSDYQPETFTGTITEYCCDTPGDANNSGSVSISDATFLIGRVFSDGPPPPCLFEGDPDGNGDINIADAVHLIAYIFSGGPAPICGP